MKLAARIAFLFGGLWVSTLIVCLELDRRGYYHHYFTSAIKRQPPPEGTTDPVAPLPVPTPTPTQQQRQEQNTDAPALQSDPPPPYAQHTFAHGHLVPSFLIVGAQKCGTTSMYRYLLEHPQVLPLNRNYPMWSSVIGEKEVRYFGSKHAQGHTIREYIKVFANESHVRELSAANGQVRYITGEASPSYMYTPYTAVQIFSDLPNVRLIVLVRDPAERAWSHSQHGKRVIANNSNMPPLDYFLDTEEKVLEGCVQKQPDATAAPFTAEGIRIQQSFMECMISGSAIAGRTTGGKSARQGRFGPWSLQHLSRGMYAPQLAPYYHYFPAERILLMRSEDFFREPSQTMGRVSEFLGIEPITWDTIVAKKYNFGKGNIISSSASSEGDTEKIPVDTKERIDRIMHPFSQRLEEELGIRWP